MNFEMKLAGWYNALLIKSVLWSLPLSDSLVYVKNTFSYILIYIYSDLFWSLGIDLWNLLKNFIIASPWVRSLQSNDLDIQWLCPTRVHCEHSPYPQYPQFPSHSSILTQGPHPVPVADMPFYICSSFCDTLHSACCKPLQSCLLLVSKHSVIPICGIYLLNKLHSYSYHVL